jgi:hypothetical protein
MPSRRPACDRRCAAQLASDHPDRDSAPASDPTSVAEQLRMRACPSGHPPAKRHRLDGPPLDVLNESRLRDTDMAPNPGRIRIRRSEIRRRGQRTPLVWNVPRRLATSSTVSSRSSLSFPSGSCRRVGGIGVGCRTGVVGVGSSSLGLLVLGSPADALDQGTSRQPAPGRQVVVGAWVDGSPDESRLPLVIGGRCREAIGVGHLDASSCQGLPDHIRAIGPVLGEGLAGPLTRTRRPPRPR